MDPSKLKVVDLRQELQQRGLDTKGVKAALVKRLKDALEKESSEESQNDSQKTSNDKIPPSDSIEESQDDDNKTEAEDVKSPDKAKSNSTPEPVNKEEKIEEKEPLEKNYETEKASVETDTEPQDTAQKPDENGGHVGESDHDQESEVSPKKMLNKTVERNAKRKRHDDSFEFETRSSKKPREKNHEPAEFKEDEPEMNYEKVQISWYDSDLNLQVDKNTFASAKPLVDGCFGFLWAGARATYGISLGKVCFEVKITEELDWHDPTKEMIDRKDKDRRHKVERHKDQEKIKNDEVKDTPSDAKEPIEVQSVKTEEASDKQTAIDSEMDVKMEVPSSESEPSTVAKTELQNDVGAEIKEEPEQVNLEEEKDKDGMKELVRELIPAYYLRVGFSLPGTTLQLGETKYSYGYESTGKFVSDKQFQDYSVTFGVGDVIGAYLSIDDEKVSISYTVNGAVQPVATTIPRSELPEESFSLFPHILCRNYAYEMNFGNREEAWFPHPEELKGYVFLQDATNKIIGPRRPEKRSDCEFILMIGLSGSGKTHWVNQFVETNKDKTYTIIGNDSVFQRMTVDGQSFKSRFSGSWRVLVDKLQKCLNAMTDIAALRRRHLIIDQTNVFPQAQNRKLRAFEGFKRKAVCVICSDEEFLRRQKMRDNDSGKNVPESTLLEQKGQIELPQKFAGLELVFPDLNEEESKKMIKKYHEEFNSKNHHKRGYNNRRDNRRSYYQPNNYRDRGYGRYDRHSYGNWQRPSGGGWGRDRRDSRGPPPSSRYSSSSGWRPSRGSRIEERSRPRDDRQSYGASRNQSGRGQVWTSNDRSSGWDQGQGWNQQPFGRHSYGGWNQQGGWKYNGGQGGGGSSYSGQGNGGGGYGGQQGWNFYGQYSQQQQGWGGGHQARKQ
ncbi:hypothetical protein GWI33_018563 [Rhynchophorus ferrugineus]|uniref:SAP domain-containing protein n=1 Tax=Rhynchophorus ferrugineus TaxID=354439 RepID=A0A834HTH6_RHYFE|nr:hypothetical protein GWI33_018563 [Rhynchophorus ferrugineus]